METILSSLKRTISVRSNSDSSESSSPQEKRSKSLAEEDEVLQALNMENLGNWRNSMQLRQR